VCFGCICFFSKIANKYYLLKRRSVLPARAHTSVTESFDITWLLSLLGRSQWPRGLKRGSTAARLLGLRVRIPPGGMDVSVLSVLCVVLVEASATGRSFVQGNFTIEGSNPARGHGCLCLVSIVCCPGRGLCDGADPSSRGIVPSVCMCHRVWSVGTVMRWVGRRGRTKTIYVYKVLRFWTIYVSSTDMSK
jgi:hypothetical protein